MILKVLIDKSIMEAMHNKFMRKNSSLITTLLSLCMVVLSACQPAASSFETETPTPLTETPTPIATRIWFPSTSTPTVYFTPQQTPTPNESPDFGGLVIADDFSDHTSWTTGVSSAGNVAYGDNTLNLAVSTPGSILASYRKDTYFSDFYLETTVTANLCYPTDSYGLIFWSLNDRTYFRITFNCSGEYTLEKVKESNVTTLHDWTPSGQIPRGGLSPFRVGLWVGGGYVRLYLNGVYQDGVYLAPATGGIGAFAHSVEGPAVSISYSDMTIYSVSPGDYPLTPTPTKKPTQRPYSTLATP
jgi:hypothetical protein